MSDELFDEGAYRRFASDLEDAVKSPSVQKVKLEDLRRPAFASARKTKFGSHGWRSMVSSRIGPKTV